MEICAVSTLPPRPPNSFSLIVLGSKPVTTESMPEIFRGCEPRNVEKRISLDEVSIGEDRLNTGHLAHGRGRPTPRSPRPWVRTTRTEVTSPMGKDDPHRDHLAHGRGRPAPRSPRPWARTDLLSRNRASSSKFPWGEAAEKEATAEKEAAHKEAVSQKKEAAQEKDAKQKAGEKKQTKKAAQKKDAKQKEGEKKQTKKAAQKKAAEKETA
ncbi:hypothetical protein HID58_025138 [Brassica napus]|uniref:Uncharacterized protein n=1 Tax=Brassica napus TaxID=3708 RepID=A0ABQ8CKC0_BRANA|nr:hypothetical protein HID58_025138 [Brassica napus]